MSARHLLSHADLVERLAPLDCDDAQLGRTPMIPIHRDTLYSILYWLREGQPADLAAAGRGSDPDAG